MEKIFEVLLRYIYFRSILPSILKSDAKKTRVEEESTVLERLPSIQRNENN